MDKFLQLNLVLGAIVSSSVNAQVLIDVEEHGSSANFMTVPFVTVRAIEHNRKGLTYYGSDRGSATVGRCNVDLDARKKRQIVNIQQASLDEILGLVHGSGGRVAVFVHGYNLTFEESCRDSALLQERVGIEGRLLLFSWPADGNVSGYLPDIGDIEWSVVPLRNLLVTLVDRFGSLNVDLIGHSLGAKGVVDVVSAYGSVRSEGSPLGRLILIAPDLDDDLFVRDFARTGELVSTVTVYVSAQDRALRASRTVRNEPRVGEGGVDWSDLDGIDVVNVSQPRWKLGTKHRYYLQYEVVAEDLREVLSGPPRTIGSRTIDLRRSRARGGS